MLFLYEQWLQHLSTFPSTWLNGFTSITQEQRACQQQCISLTKSNSHSRAGLKAGKSGFSFSASIATLPWARLPKAMLPEAQPPFCSSWRWVLELSICRPGSDPLQRSVSLCKEVWEMLLPRGSGRLSLQLLVNHLSGKWYRKSKVVIVIEAWD